MRGTTGWSHMASCSCTIRQPRLDTDGHGILGEIRDTITHGLQRPPLPITALPLAT